MLSITVAGIPSIKSGAYNAVAPSVDWARAAAQ